MRAKPNFICISGKAQNGKDTSAEYMREHLESIGKKTLVIHNADLLKFICRSFFGWDGVKDQAGRTMLQKVGTEGVRTKMPTFWIDFILDVVGLFPEEWDYIIIPDTRYPNEISRILDRAYSNVMHLRVVRPNFESPLTEEQKNHISETALDEAKPDFYIINDGSLNLLKSRVINITDIIMEKIEERKAEECEECQLKIPLDNM